MVEFVEIGNDLIPVRNSNPEGLSIPVHISTDTYGLLARKAVMEETTPTDIIEKLISLLNQKESLKELMI